MHVFLDYTVIGKLYQINMGEYNGSIVEKERLKKLQSLAEERKICCYMSDISKVEMLHGREKSDSSGEQVERYKEKDESKLKIAGEMGVVWQSYPASRLNEHLETREYPFGYSRLNLTLTALDEHWVKAYEIEKKLLLIKGVSPGDARQIVSMVFGSPLFEGKDFVAKDKRLVNGIKEEIRQGKLNELTKYFFGSVQDFLSAFENAQR